MAEIQELECVICGKSYAPGVVQYTCPACGDVGTLDVVYDYGKLASQLDRGAFAVSGEYSMWRFHELLPLADASDHCMAHPD